MHPPVVMPAPSPMVSSSTLMAKSTNIGFATGGAKDSNSFQDNIKNGYLPKFDSITYEGVFYQHFFGTQLQGECQSLFCPSYISATTMNPFTKESETYLSVGLNSNIKQNEYKRKKLNLVIVLYIS